MIDKVLLNTGFKLSIEGRFDEANKIFDELLENNPKDLSLFGMLANLFVKTKQIEKAKDCLRKICKIKEDFNTITTLGMLEYQTQNYDRAAAIFEKALTLGKTVEIYSSLLTSYRYLRKYANLLVRAKEMLELYPDNFDAIHGIINSLMNTGKVFEAKEFCFKYLQKFPKTPFLWIDFGFIEELTNSNTKQALEYYLKAYELDKDNTSTAPYHIALAYCTLKDYENAFKYYNICLKRDPNDISAKTDLGMLQLRLKQFKEGYHNYYQRKIYKHALDGASENIYKLGAPLEKDIVIICDQGYGDHIQFIRYLPVIKNKFNSIQVVTPKPLMKLFEENFPDIDFIDVSELDPKKQAIRICDMPIVFDIDFDNVPYPEGYLNIKPTDIKSEKLKVGLCCEAGGVNIRGPLQRTVHIDYFDKIFKLDNIQTYFLQLEDSFNAIEKYPQMINLGKDFKDFSDTAKAIKAMDLVICVDTSVMHLAAALGVKTFLLLPYITDWRWFDDTKTTPWYDSVEIFKQIDPIDWVKPIEDIICRLKELSS